MSLTAALPAVADALAAWLEVHDRMRFPTGAFDDVVELALRIRAGQGPAAVDRAAFVEVVAAIDTMIAAIV